MSDRVAQSDSAEGSREVIQRELARQEQREKADGGAGASLTRRDVLAALRDADDHVIAEIVATGASLEELTKAVSWMTDDAAARKVGISPPSGRVAHLIDLLRSRGDGFIAL